MSNEIVATNDSSIVTQELLMDYLVTMNKGLNEKQIKQFVAVAGAFGLNPWKREIYAVTFKNQDGGYDMSIVTGYETYIKRAEMNPYYDGYEIEFKGSFKKGTVTKNGKNGSYNVQALLPDGEVSCVCKVFRKDRQHPVVEEVFFDEYDQRNSMWQSKPRTMLKKCAIVSAFRKAFPIDFGGMPYTTDELPEEMTGAEKLNAQGHVEVSADEHHEITEEEKTANFVNMMEKMHSDAKEVYESALKEKGVDDVKNIKAEDRQSIYKFVYNAIVESKKNATEEKVEF